jgi:hypothetical protein
MNIPTDVFDYEMKRKSALASFLDEHVVIKSTAMTTASPPRRNQRLRIRISLIPGTLDQRLFPVPFADARNESQPERSQSHVPPG